jgi:ribosome-associated protein
MKVKKDNKDFVKLKDCIINAMFDKKAEDVVSIDLRKFTNRMADVFIICHCQSTTHAESIANFVEEMAIKKLREKPFHKEGFENKEWILLDYFDIVVHVFIEEKRGFYSIEELWGDGEISHHKQVVKNELKK